MRIDEAIQEALSNPKHRLLGAKPGLPRLALLCSRLRTPGLTTACVVHAVLRVEEEVRQFVQSTRSELFFGQSLTGFQACPLNAPHVL